MDEFDFWEEEGDIARETLPLRSNKAIWTRQKLVLKKGDATVTAKWST